MGGSKITRAFAAAFSMLVGYGAPSVSARQAPEQIGLMCSFKAMAKPDSSGRQFLELALVWPKEVNPGRKSNTVVFIFPQGGVVVEGSGFFPFGDIPQEVAKKVFAETDDLIKRCLIQARPPAAPSHSPPAPHKPGQRAGLPLRPAAPAA